MRLNPQVVRASEALTRRGAEAMAKAAQNPLKHFYRLSKVHKAAVICAGTGAALILADQVYGTDILRKYDLTIATPLSPQENKVAQEIHKYCAPRPQICIDNANEAKEIVGLYVDEKGKNRGWFYKYFWNDDARQKRKLTSYVIGLWGIEGSLSKTPSHAGSQYQGPMQFSLNGSSSYIWDKDILTKLLQNLNEIKSSDLIKDKYPALANLDVLTEQNLHDKAIFEMLPVQEIAVILGFERTAKKHDGALSPKFSHSEIEALSYLQHNFPHSTGLIVAEPDNECSIASRDPSHMRFYRSNAGLYRSGAAWSREILYRAQTYMNAAREYYDLQGFEPQSSLPLRFQDKSMLHRAIYWGTAHRQCGKVPPLSKQEQEPPQSLPQQPAFVDACATTKKAYAVTLTDAHGVTTDILPSYCADASRIPASITKLMTIAVTLDAVNKGTIKSDQPIKISAEAASQARTRLGLKIGQTLTLQQALEAIVVKSANDIAVAIAESVSGTQESFVARMNEKAHDLGMSQTVFGNPSGLPGANRSTAHDIAKLMRAVMQYKQYRAIARLADTSIHNQIIHGHNPLLSGVAAHGSERCVSGIGANGGKTGFTRDSGANNVLHFTLPDRYEVTVVYMGADTALQRDLEIMDLLDKARNSNGTLLKTIPQVTRPKVTYSHGRPHCS